VLGHLDETRLLLASLALYSLGFTIPGPKENVIIVGHAPLYLIPFSSFLWFTVRVIFSCHSSIITPCILFWFYRVPMLHVSFVRACTYTH